ncbi:nuclear transport factor 2 family protein [Luteibacter aegosomaticola]|uniref:nuclear transport factor 2 family protein n=1 Tax=Luteibacter aegosomaticola TaxID=2911538 RepID=UPI001FF7D3DF|nr:nuclear transport factor 2 family protein [Luteibacter aegosomaticola]UPG89631.1 nuclear transport factor 2 family protein [Luteibacter aegosomaticola]
MARAPFWSIAALAAFVGLGSAVAAPLDQAPKPEAAAQEALVRTVTALDTQLFGTFNTCDQPGQLDKHAAMLDPNLEFYHDNGGVTWTRKDYVERTGQNVCGHFRRKLVQGSLQIYPVKDFGAIEEGDQDFCDLKTDKCFGAAHFMILWHQTPNGWLATRVFSYGHHAL